MASATARPYFFEEHFPASYHLTYAPPVRHYPGYLNPPLEEIGQPHMERDGFVIYIDVKDFKAHEISVKTVDQTIIVEGKQEKRPGVSVPRHFVRNFRLPDYFDSEDVFPFISDDGILEIKALPASMKRCRANVAPTIPAKKAEEPKAE